MQHNSKMPPIEDRLKPQTNVYKQNQLGIHISRQNIWIFTIKWISVGVHWCTLPQKSVSSSSSVSVGSKIGPRIFLLDTNEKDGILCNKELQLYRFSEKFLDRFGLPSWRALIFWLEPNGNILHSKYPSQMKLDYYQKPKITL